MEEEKTDQEDFMKCLITVFRRANPHIPADYADEKCIRLIRKWLMRTINIAKVFDSPILSDLAGIQRACMYYMIDEGIDREKRLDTLKAWEKWFDINLACSSSRSFITRNLQGFHHLLSNIRKYTRQAD